MEGLKMGPTLLVTIGVILGIIIGADVTLYFSSHKSATIDEQPIVKEEPVAHDASTDTAPDTLSLPAGDSARIPDVTLDNDGWVAIGETADGHITRILGAARRDAGHHSTVVISLIRPMLSGHNYVVAIYRDDGDRAFSLQSDTLVTDGAGHPVFTAFTAK